MKKIIIAIGALCLVLFALAQDFTLSSAIQERVAAGTKPVIVVSYHDVSNEFAPFIKKGVEQAAAELNVDARIVGPVGADADKQIAELESLIETGVDGIAISSVSTDALAPVIDRALAEGIPVVTYNTDNPGSQRLAFAGQDLVQSGVEAGMLMCSTLGNAGKVIITTLDAAAQWSIDREKGAREGLATCPDVEIVSTINTGTEPQQIYSSIENAMLANPDVTGILSLECCSTPAAGEYVKRNNLGEQVKVVGFDLLPATVSLVQEGIVSATIDQAPEKQSFEAVRMLLDVLNGQSVSDVDTGVAVYTPENIQEYLDASGGN
jgi:simple sugar transport system substrate-binding protein